MAWTIGAPAQGGYHRVVNGPFHILCPTSILDTVVASLNCEPDSADDLMALAEETTGAEGGPGL